MATEIKPRQIKEGKNGQVLKTTARGVEWTDETNTSIQKDLTTMVSVRKGSDIADESSEPNIDRDGLFIVTDTYNPDRKTESSTRENITATIDEFAVRYKPTPVYGMVRAKADSAAQVISPGNPTDVQWNWRAKKLVNITYDEPSNSWIVPEDGVYAVSATIETVDVNEPFGLAFQRQEKADGGWRMISSFDITSYPSVGRGKTITIFHHFYQGDKVNVKAVAIGGATRIGGYRTVDDNYFSIVKVSNL